MKYVISIEVNGDDQEILVKTMTGYSKLQDERGSEVTHVHMKNLAKMKKMS